MDRSFTPDVETIAPSAAPSSTRGALASLSLSLLMPSLDTSIANSSLPTLQQSFGASFESVQWIVIAYLLSITALIVGAARLGDIFGQRRLLLVGIGLFTAASLLCGLAPSLALLVAARALQGLGAALLMSLTLTMVAEAVPAARTGSAVGLLGTMSAIGTTLGPSLGGILVAAFGWRSIFLVNVPLGLVTLFLARRFLPDSRRKAPDGRAGFDVSGTLVLASALAAYALALTYGRARFGWPAAALLATAALGVRLFFIVEARSRSPLLRLATVRDSALRSSLVLSGLVSSVMMATMVVGPFYLSRSLGLGTAMVGIAISVGPIVVAIAGLPAGRLVDRIGTRTPTVIGLGGIGAGASLLAIFPARFGMAGYLAPIAVMAASYALFQSANNTSILRGSHPDERGVRSALLSLSRNLGLITGSAGLGAIFAWASSASDISSASPAAVAFGMRVTFATSASLMFAALASVTAFAPAATSARSGRREQQHLG
ncbi:MAG: MFS transporter [Thermoanaerobaculia bacterium]